MIQALFRRDFIKSKRADIALVLLALVPLAQHKIDSLLIFPVFVLVRLLSPYLGIFNRIPLPLFIRHMTLGLLACLLEEYFVFQVHFGLFSEKLLNDLLLSLGIYGALIVVWYELLRRYEFTLLEVFCSGGVWGIVFEQNFRILLSFNPMAYLYVFLVYGSFVAIPFVILQKSFERDGRRTGRKKYLIAFLAQSLAYPFGFAWIATLRTAFGV